MQLDATLAMISLVWSRGCRSHRTEMDFVAGGNSSRPYTVVRIPEMWKVLDEIEGGGVE
jgi:hypothetical protein